MKHKAAILGVISATALVGPPAFAGPGGPAEAKAPTPCAALAKVLQTACASGAIKRVLGARRYRMTYTSNAPGAPPAAAMPKGRVTVRGRVLPADAAGPRRLELEVTRRVSQAGLAFEVTTHLEVGIADGRTYHVLIQGRHGPLATRVEGTLVGNQIRYRIQEPGAAPRTEAAPWRDDWVPEEVATYVLPALFDQGAPGELTCGAPAGPGEGAGQGDAYVLKLPRAEAKGARIARIESGNPTDGTHVVEVHYAARGAQAGRILQVRQVETTPLSSPGQARTLVEVRTLTPLEKPRAKGPAGSAPTSRPSGD